MKLQRSLFWDIVMIVALVTIVCVVLFSCVTIVDGRREVTKEAQKQKHSTKFLIVMQDTVTKELHSTYWNSNCWKCKVVNVPQLWDVIIYSNGRSVSKPVN